jgi:hypothetical protein
MNTKKKIEQYLHSAPAASPTDDLLDRLKEDVSTAELKTHRSAIRRWFAPTGQSISLGRVVAAAVIAIVVVLPLSYGAAKAVKYVITTFEAKFEYHEDNTVYGVKTSIFTSGDNIQSEEDAQKATEEFYNLYKEGKAKEVKPNIWVATLSNGEKFAYGGDPENIKGDGLSDAEKRKLLKKQFDEIHELRKAGRFEKIYKPEHDFAIDGVKYRYFVARYTLASGKVVTVGDSEPVKDEDKQ